MTDPTRRHALAMLTATASGAALPRWSAPATATPRAVTTGADRLAATKFDVFKGKRVGLITNQTGRIGNDHIVDVLARSPGLTLVALFGPEHGVRGVVEAGAKVADERDLKTGIRVFSLYGTTRAPTDRMLADIDLLAFDIQDVGVRFYTYISTMGLAMAAAARRRIPFVVLDRPNPLGGIDVSGFVLDPRLTSFVGQYPIPIVHGMTVGELAHMIKAERWLPGLEQLDLQVIACTGWTRDRRWPATGIPWIATSPNVPTFESALYYPGVGVIGETLVNEGRGTPLPFQQFGTPWLDEATFVAALNAARLPGVTFEAVRYVPRTIPNVAATPRFMGSTVRGVLARTHDAQKVRPLDTGMHALALLQQAARRASIEILPTGAMFTAIAGTPRLRALLSRGASGADIVAAWQAEVTAFKRRREAYLLYT